MTVTIVTTVGYQEIYPLSPAGYVEPLSEARMAHGKRRVSARRGWAGEKSDFFSILLGVS